MAWHSANLHDWNRPSHVPAQRAVGRSILSFNLFGESAELPDVLQVETIAARSALHGWELQPQRHARLSCVFTRATGVSPRRFRDRPGA